MRKCLTLLLALFWTQAVAPPAKASTSLSGLVFSPTTLDFGTNAVNKNKALTLTVRNNASPTTRLAVQFSSSSAAFTVTPTSATLGPGQSATITVRLLAQSAPGTFQATISAVAGQARVQAKVSAAVNKLTPAPASLTFPKINVGQNQNQTLTFKNEGPAQVTCAVSMFAGSSPSQFGVSNFTVTPASVTLGPNQQGTATINFAARNLEQMTSATSNAQVQIDCGGELKSLVVVKGELNVFLVAVTRGPQAPFNAQFSFAIQVTNNASAAAGGGVKCGALQAFPNICQGVVAPGAQISATATPSSGVFAKWLGTGSAASCNNSTAAQCSFTVTGEAKLTAN